jgi:hypothetical protein
VARGQRHMNIRASCAAPRALLLLGLAVVLFPAGAGARNLFSTEIPNGESQDCGACHINIDTALNLTWFGVDVALTYEDYTNPKPIWPSIYALDSDADGQTNGEELGDPCGDWAYGEDATFEETSNPGDALSVLEELPFYECTAGSDDDDSSATDDDDSSAQPADDDEITSCLYSVAGEHSATWPLYLLVLWLLSRRGDAASGDPR